jgi:hypothetical protein
MEEKKKKLGRKRLPPKEKKVPIRIFVSKGKVDAKGGETKLKEALRKIAEK